MATSLSPAWRRARAVALWLLATLITLALAAGLAGIWTVRASFAQHGGELRLPGLSAPVRVLRDAHGIPHVYASTAADLFRAQGYVHAQDRFWEMDFRRHLTAGRLAEMFGSDQVDTDAYLRTMGWRRVAEAEWRLITDDSRANLRAYAEGVNAWLEATGGPAPSREKSLEYAVLGLINSGYTVAPWDPVDSLAWLKAMAWDLRGNMDDEIDRSLLLASGLDRRQVEQLYPAYPFGRNRRIVDSGTISDGSFAATPDTAGGAGAGTAAGHQPPRGGTAAGTGSPVSGPEAVQALRRVRAGLAALPNMIGQPGPEIGSNSWVIAGSHTATGKPILANDPHLGPSMPGIWYQMGLHCRCAYDVAGFSFSGVPGVVIGHNDRIAWGFTNLGPDVTDLYLERVDGDRYLSGGTWREMRVRTERIAVAGGDPVTIRVRSTAHGPVLSDASEELRKVGASPDTRPGGPGQQDTAPGAPARDDRATEPAGSGYAIALRWTALDPGRTVDALFALNRAGDWASFRAAAALFEVPAQNLVYADVDGTIGYQAPGRIPVRGKGDGRWPAPGWDPAYDWRGFIPFGALPSVVNPPRGYIVTANQAVIGPRYPALLTADWSYGYRSQRINDMLAEAGGRITVADVARMQFDNRNGMAPTLVPALLAVDLEGRAVRSRDLLRGWDFQQPADGGAGTAAGRSSAAAAYYNAVWRHLLILLFDELPADRGPGGGDRWFEVVRALLAQPDSPWWDVRDSAAREGAPDILRTALADAAAELTRAQGDDPAGWRWGAMHRLTLRNATLGESGVAPIEWLFNRGPAPVSGGGAIVNATSWDAASGGYDVTQVPSMRMIVDMSNLDQSRWIQLTGNSGHAFSGNYDDQFPLWREGGTLRMRWSEAAVRRDAAHTLILRR